MIRLGRFIRDHDLYAHPLTVHNRTGDDPYRDSDWTTFGTLQGPKTRDRAELSKGLLESHHPRKPLFAQETLWSGNQYHIKRNGGDYSDDDLRKHAFVFAMSATSFCFADNRGNSSSGFSGSLDLADCSQRRHDVIRRAWDILESLPLLEMKPAQDLVTRGYCLAQSGRRYFVYLETPGRVSIQLSPGKYRITWIDPRNGNRRDGGTVNATDNDMSTLETPGDGEDWLLQLDR